MRVLITGVTGQDGTALAEQCIAAGHDTYGLVRWISQARHHRTDLPTLGLIDGDLTDPPSLTRALRIAEPDVVYNLAALAASGQSWAQPVMISQINGLGVLHLLEAIRAHNPAIRFVQASTSEQFGVVDEQPQNEATPFRPVNTYGAAKVFAHQVTQVYRASYKMHASTALMFNHVSERRHPYFVDRKITQGVARIAKGLSSQLTLGQLSAARDWGWGPEYMAAWQLIAAQDSPGDYVLATGELHTVRELVDMAFAVVGLDPAEHVVFDPELVRPTDIYELVGDTSATQERLGWRAQIRFGEIVARMVEHDLSLL